MATSLQQVVPVASAERVLDAQGVRIDLRSPGEFQQDHLPGAHSVPLFDDLDRSLIGTLYAKRSPEVAFDAARERTLERIGALTERIAELAGWEPPSVDLRDEVQRIAGGGIERLEGGLVPTPLAELPERPVALYCWRGGLRSRSVVALLRGLGLQRACAIEGGYKAYRRLVLSRLDGWAAPPTFVLRGLTGVGKTLVLRAIEALRPGWTVDLEALAGHRSSILGMVGLEPCSQRTFESRLAERLRRAAREVCVVEGESRKVGDAIQPARLWEALSSGVGIELTASTERRIDVLVEDYLARPANREELARQLPFLEARLGERRWSGELVRLLEAGAERELVALLLERYYDPLYRHSERRHAYATSLDATDPAAAAAEVVAWIERRA